MRDPRSNPPSLPAAPSYFHESTEAIPAALQERGEKQEHETQLQNVDRNAAPRRHTFCRRARSVQPGPLNRNSDRRTASTPSGRRSTAVPRSGR